MTQRQHAQRSPLRSRGQAAKKRDQMPEQFAALGPGPSHDALIAMNRKLNSSE
jgi:hypothetical protein